MSEIPDEVLITIPEPENGSDESLKESLKKYHLDLDIDPDSEDYLNLYYNQDLRSFCGWSEEFNTLRMFPEYYAKGWEDTYWKKLKDEALEFEVVK